MSDMYRTFKKFDAREDFSVAICLHSRFENESVYLTLVCDHVLSIAILLN